MNSIVNLEVLARQLAATTGRDIDFCRTFIVETFASISRQIADEKRADLPSFGSFFHDDTDGSVTFHPGEQLAVAVNEPFSIFEPLEIDPSISAEIINYSGEEAASESQIQSTIHQEAEPEKAEEVITEEAIIEEVAPEEATIEQENTEEALAKEVTENIPVQETPVKEVTVKEESTPNDTKQEVSAQEDSGVEKPISDDPTRETPSKIEEPIVVPGFTYCEDDNEDVYMDSGGANRWLIFIVGLLLGIIIGATGVYLLQLYC